MTSSKATAFLWALGGFVIGTVLVPFVGSFNTTTTGSEYVRLLEEEQEEEEEENSVLEYTIVVGIVLLLILLTILFEYTKDYAEEACSRTTRPIIESLFGELTVLGFLSIFTFVVTKAGWFVRLGESLFGNDRQEELLEVFESVHYTIFFIMCFFVIQVLVLMREANTTATDWLHYEKMVQDSHTRWSVRAAEFEVASTYFTIMRWISSYASILPCFKDKKIMQQQQVLLLYKALRDEFVLDRELDYPFSPSEERIDQDFNFGRYLGVCQASFLQKVVHVKISTWVLFAVGVVLYYLFILMVHCNETVLAWTWVAFAWFVCLYNIHFERHLLQVITAFASKGVHYMAHHHDNNEQPTPTAISETTESTGLLESSDDTTDHLLPDWCHVNVEQYMNNRSFWRRCFAGGVPNRQQALYWMDRKGPPLYLFILQFDLLFVGIFSSLQFIQIGPFMYHTQPLWVFWLYVVLACIPIFNLVLNKRRLVAVLTPVVSLGFYRRPQVIANVIREEKTAQGVRTFITVYKLRRFAMQASFPKEKHSHFHYSQVFDKHEIEEVGRTFDEFDIDGSGNITLDEFEKLMSRLGADLTQEQLRNMMESLDTDKSGGVDRDEFIQWYADHSHDEGISEEEFAKFMFHVFDQNDSGELTIGEFKKKLEHVSTRFSVDEVGALVNELDTNNGGTICEEEFEHLIKKYWPRELGSGSDHH